jgi:hypothetical protein
LPDAAPPPASKISGDAACDQELPRCAAADKNHSFSRDHEMGLGILGCVAVFLFFFLLFSSHGAVFTLAPRPDGDPSARKVSVALFVRTCSITGVKKTHTKSKVNTNVKKFNQPHGCPQGWIKVCTVSLSNCLGSNYHHDNHVVNLLSTYT